MVCESADAAFAAIAANEFGYPLVLKADGLAEARVSSLRRIAPPRGSNRPLGDGRSAARRRR
jgi:hypothetical protein